MKVGLEVRMNEGFSMFNDLDHHYFQKLRKPLAIILLIVLISLLVYSVVWAYLTYIEIGSKGVIKTYQIGAYFDSACNSKISFIDWGMIEPGSVINTTFYIRNEGNVPTTISLSTTDWQPVIASTYISLTGDCDGRTMQPQDVFITTFTLTVSSATNISDFTVNIIISQLG